MNKVYKLLLEFVHYTITFESRCMLGFICVHRFLYVRFPSSSPQASARCTEREVVL